MPFDTWAHQPTVTRHDRGWSVPVAVTEVDVEAEDGPATAWSGLRLEVSGLTAAEVQAAVDADPDAGVEHVGEACEAVAGAVGWDLRAIILDADSLQGGL